MGTPFCVRLVDLPWVTNGKVTWFVPTKLTVHNNKFQPLMAWKKVIQYKWELWLTLNPFKEGLGIHDCLECQNCPPSKTLCDNSNALGKHTSQNHNQMEKKSIPGKYQKIFGNPQDPRFKVFSLSIFFFFFGASWKKYQDQFSIGFISSRSFCRFLNKRFLKCLLVLSSLKRNFQIWPQIPSFQELQPSLIMTLGHSTEFQGGIFPFLMEWPWKMSWRSLENQMKGKC